jgi:hypothetical protein
MAWIRTFGVSLVIGLLSVVTLPSFAQGWSGRVSGVIFQIDFTGGENYGSACIFPLLLCAGLRQELGLSELIGLQLFNLHCRSHDGENDR